MTTVRARTTALATIAAVALTLSGTAVAAQSVADEVAELLTQRFFEVEFFVFERSAVMDFNTREILIHREPQPYPSPLLALPYPDQVFGSGYQIDLMTQLCLSYPTLTYSVTDEGEFMDNSSPEPTSADEATIANDGLTSGSDASGSDGSDQEISESPPIEPALDPDPMQELIAAVAEFELELEQASNRWMPDATFTLQREARRVESRAGGRILFHGRWLQPVPPRETPLPVMLPAGAHTGAGKELSGSVGVTLGRYLHFRTALNYLAPALGARPLQVAFSPAGAAVPIADTGNRDAKSDSKADSKADAKIPANTGAGFMTLAQSRRMRSQELHYLDHPKLGVVVRITPIAIPEQLQALKIALEGGEQ
jgi:hypothetical protein